MLTTKSFDELRNRTRCLRSLFCELGSNKFGYVQVLTISRMKSNVSLSASSTRELFTLSEGRPLLDCRFHRILKQLRTRLLLSGTPSQLPCSPGSDPTNNVLVPTNTFSLLSSLKIGSCLLSFVSCKKETDVYPSSGYMMGYGSRMSLVMS